jgi:hypothetical protein
MVYEQMPIGADKAQSAEKYEFSRENFANGEAMKEVFSTPSFQEMENSFIDGREAKLTCTLTILADKYITLETAEPISANTLLEAQDKINTWANEAIAAQVNPAYDGELEIKKFILDYSFEKDNEEVQTGLRKIIETT